MTEEWKPIEGYEGLYEVSSFGRVKSLAKTVRRGRGGSYSTPERFLAANSTSIIWPTVKLPKGKKVAHFQVKRLVAAAFVPNPNKSYRLVERDGDKTNCRADNLEWSWARPPLAEAKKGRRVSVDGLHQLIRSAVEEWAAERGVDPGRAWDGVRSKRWHRFTDPEKP